MSGQLSLSNLVTSNLSVDFINTDLIPGNSNLSLGSLEKPFKELFVSAGTIHVGTVSLSDNQGFLSTDKPMRIGSNINTRITIGANTGISIGSAVFNNTGLKFDDGAGGETIVDNTIFTKIENIAKLQASTAVTKNNDDFGFLTDYVLNISSNNSGSNSISSITNANFELGKLFNTSNSLNLNTFITATRTNNLYEFDSTGVVTLFTEAQKTNRLNKRLDNNAINIILTPTKQVLIPIETNTTIRDVFPLNILDVNKKDGRLKFKSDFDNVGSLYYLDQSNKLSGLCNLKNYVQLSDPQFASMYNLKDQVIPLSKNEYIVDFISYYNLPILFESQLSDNLSSYDYYISSLQANRVSNKVYRHEPTNPLLGSTQDNVTIAPIRDMSTVQGFNKSFYPAIRVIKWKNIYTPSFTKLEADSYEMLKTKLKWTNVAELYTKYTTGTNTGENWIQKLVELTFAYLKYGKPLKPLNAQEKTSVQTIMTSISNDATKSAIKLDTNLLEISIKSSAFTAYLTL